MASNVAGDMARTMAVAPVSHSSEPEAKPNGLGAGHTLAEQLSEAQKESAKSGAEKLSRRMRKNPVTDVFTAPRFELESSKEYPDDRTPGKTSQKVGRVVFDLSGSGIPFNMTVYLYKQAGRDQQGDFTDRWFTVSIPKGAIGSIKDRPELAMQLDALREDARAKFETWYENVSANAGMTGGSTPHTNVRRERPKVQGQQQDQQR